MSIKYKKNSTTVNDVAYNVPSIPDVAWYDTALSATSTKPLQTKVIRDAIDAKKSAISTVVATEAENTATLSKYQKLTDYYNNTAFNSLINADKTALNATVATMNSRMTNDSARNTDLANKPKVEHYQPTGSDPERALQHIGSSWQIPGAQLKNVTTAADLYHNVITLVDDNEPDNVTRSFTVPGLSNTAADIPNGTVIRWTFNKGFTTSMTIPDTPRLIINGVEFNVRAHGINGYGTGVTGLFVSNDMGLKWYKINGISVPNGKPIGTTHNGFEMSYNRLVATGYDGYEMVLEPQVTVDKRVFVTPGITLELVKVDNSSFFVLGKQLMVDFKVQYKTAYSNGSWVDCGWLKCYSDSWKECEYDVRWLTDKYQDTDAVYHLRFPLSFNSDRYMMGNFVAVIPIKSNNTVAYTGNSYVTTTANNIGVPTNCANARSTINCSVKVKPSTLDGYRIILKGY